MSLVFFFFFFLRGRPFSPQPTNKFQVSRFFIFILIIKQKNDVTLGWVCNEDCNTNIHFIIPGQLNSLSMR